MMLAQCGAASCDWRATPAHEEAPARGEPGLGSTGGWHLLLTIGHQVALRSHNHHLARCNLRATSQMKRVSIGP